MIVLESHIVEKEPNGIRFVDYVIGLFPKFSTRNAVKKAIKRQELLLNGDYPTTGVYIRKGDRIEWIDPQHNLPKSFPLEVEVCYEDDYMVIVNKPSGIPVSGNAYRTLENALIDQVIPSSQPDALKWAKPVHRLDAPTSGLVIFSKTAEAHRRLAGLFEHRKISKTYEAIVCGKTTNELTISTPIEGLDSESFLVTMEVRKSLNNEYLSLVRLFPKTGRTHQLRIHCASIGHPIAGDKQYGQQGKVLLHKGLFLAAVELKFEHPFTQDNVKCSIPRPEKFLSYMKREEERWYKFNG